MHYREVKTRMQLGNIFQDLDRKERLKLAQKLAEAEPLWNAVGCYRAFEFLKKLDAQGDTEFAKRMMRRLFDEEEGDDEDDTLEHLPVGSEGMFG